MLTTGACACVYNHGPMHGIAASLLRIRGGAHDTRPIDVLYAKRVHAREPLPSRYLSSPSSSYTLSVSLDDESWKSMRWENACTRDFSEKHSRVSISALFSRRYPRANAERMYTCSVRRENIPNFIIIIKSQIQFVFFYNRIYGDRL